MNRLPLLTAVALLLALTGCKFVETAELAARAEASAKPAAGSDVAGRWDAEIVPYIVEKAKPLAEIRAALGGGLDATGKTFGYREVPEGAPWNFPVAITGTIVEANTKSRAATADIDTDGDGKADATLQLGPVIKGTSIRDVLPFVSFTSYSNQIEYADVAKAFNTQAFERVLKDLPRDALIGSRVEATGVFTLRTAADKVLVTPVLVKLGAGA
jgi:predicted lipoprotein